MLNRKRTLGIGVGLLALIAALVIAGDGKDKLRASLGESEVDPLWIYDDIYAAVALAKKCKKPLLVVFR
ncbi:MAG: hypothetical protein ACYTHM_04625 [Planctomycetota bacterium]|jgi:hypothetical protein